MIVIIATTKVKDIADRDRMLAVMAPCSEQTRKEPGVIEYWSSIDTSDPLLFRMVEMYPNEAAMISHLTSEHFLSMLSAVSDIESTVTVKAYKGGLEPFDVMQAVAQGTFSDSPGEGMSFSVQ
jgi:quinol monooxygenase YgiN